MRACAQAAHVPRHLTELRPSPSSPQSVRNENCEAADQWIKALDSWEYKDHIPALKQSPELEGWEASPMGCC